MKKVNLMLGLALLGMVKVGFSETELFSRLKGKSIVCLHDNSESDENGLVCEKIEKLLADKNLETIYLDPKGVQYLIKKLGLTASGSDRAEVSKESAGDNQLKADVAVVVREKRKLVDLQWGHTPLFMDQIRLYNTFIQYSYIHTYDVRFIDLKKGTNIKVYTKTRQFKTRTWMDGVGAAYDYIDNNREKFLAGNDYEDHDFNEDRKVVLKDVLSAISSSLSSFF